MVQLYPCTYGITTRPILCDQHGIETVLVIQHERPSQFQPTGFHHRVDALYGGALKPDSQLILLVETAVVDVCIAVDFQNDRVLRVKVCGFQAIYRPAIKNMFVNPDVFRIHSAVFSAQSLGSPLLLLTFLGFLRIPGIITSNWCR